MEIASFLKLLSQTDGFGFGFFVFGCFSQFFNLIFLCCLLVLGLNFLFFKGTSLFVQYLKKLDLISPKIECCSSFDQEHTDCYNNNNGLRLSKKTKKSCKNCDLLLLRDGIDLTEERDSTAALPEAEHEDEGSEDEESRPWNDEDQVFDVTTLRKMVKRERKRGDFFKIELEKERRAAESAAEEAMAMLLKLGMEKSVVEMEAKQYKRVAEQKQIYDQEVIQTLQWMLLKLDDREHSRLTL